MPRIPIPNPARWVLMLSLLVLLPAASWGDVPRSCIHPRANPIECVRDQREALLKVVPSARRRALLEQRSDLERAVEVQSLQRNQLLEEILDTLRGDDRGY